MDQLNGVDFDKGCYVGEEVVSRMEHRGTARTRIVPATYEGRVSRPISAWKCWLVKALRARSGTGANGRGLVMIRLDRAADGCAAGQAIRAGGIPSRSRSLDYATFPFPDLPAAKRAEFLCSRLIDQATESIGPVHPLPADMFRTTQSKHDLSAAAFPRRPPEIQHALISANPLGLLVTVGRTGLTANPLPFMLHADASPDGTLRAHLSRANPQWQDFDPSQEVLVVFQGVETYITPSWYETKRETGKVVPTWNYAIVQVYGPLIVRDDPEWLLNSDRVN